MLWVKRLIVASVILLALDFSYIAATKKIFEDQIINVQRVIMTVKPTGAIACYIFLILGLYYFILQNKRPATDAALLGLVIYGVYETTNYAILKKWSPFVVLIDTLWGSILFGLTTHLTYMIV